jgi:hypothetical protein
MLTAMLAVRNIVFGEKNDLWGVNAEPGYQEEIREAEILKPETAAAVFGTITRIFSRLDPIAFGVAVGFTSGISLFLATIFLIVKGGEVVGPNLQLLSQFFPGYRVNIPGSFIGFLYASLMGYLLGSVVAYLRNLAVYLTVKILNKDIELHVLAKFLEYI